jgi:nucleoid DNA-binding protein
MNINKLKLTKLIAKRIDHAVPKREIYSAIEIICEEVSSLLSEGESVRVGHFGTLAVYTVNGHGYCIPAGKSGYVEPIKSVKLYPHITVKRLIADRKDSFRNPSGRKKA